MEQALGGEHRVTETKTPKAGLVYVGWVPPKMTPSKLRSLMSQYGEVHRIYLAPEDPEARKRRRKQGGSRGKLYTEGWVEFVRRKEAKQAALMLHNEPVGGKSSNRYDLWCLRYLPKVTWDMLTEEVQQFRAIKDTRLKEELAQAKREKDFYLQQVDKAKKMEAIQARRERQAASAGTSTQAASATGDSSAPLQDSSSKGAAKQAQDLRQSTAGNKAWSHQGRQRQKGMSGQGPLAGAYQQVGFGSELKRKRQGEQGGSSQKRGLLAAEDGGGGKGGVGEPKQKRSSGKGKLLDGDGVLGDDVIRLLVGAG